MSNFLSYVKRTFNRLRTLSIKFYHWLEIDELTGMIILGVIMGIIGGFVSVGFRYYISFCQTLFWELSVGVSTTTSYLEQISWVRLLMTPMIGGLIVGPLIYFFSYEVSGSGIPEVLKSIVANKGVISPKLTLLEPLVSGITIGSGGSAGREGPIVETGAAAGSSLGQFLNLRQNKVQTLIGCGAAAGIAGTFNAPLGGVMFSLEVLLEDFQISQFSPIVVASVVATAISHAFLGATPAFRTPTYIARSHWELLGYALLGVLAGIIGYIFTKTLYTIESNFKTLNMPDYFKPALGGLFLGLIGLGLPHVYGVGYETIEHLIFNDFSWWMLIGLLIGKILATSMTLGSGGSGGIFSPSLFIGATLGSLYGIVMSMLSEVTFLSSAPPSSYALIGMGALVSATTHAPMTSILLLFEMTQNHLIILPLLVACILSYYVAYLFSQSSIYTQKLTNRGIDILAGKETNILQSIPVKEAMVREVDYIKESAKLEEVQEIFRKTHHTHFPVTNKDGKVRGLINYVDSWEIIEEEGDYPIIARDLARTPPVTVNENDNLLAALQKITDFHVELLIVVDNQNQLGGVLSRNDIIETYNMKLRDRRRT